MPHMPVLSYETIADDLIVCTSQLHRFGTDAVLLTEFSEYRQKDRVCDLGTGCGIIPILMQRTAPPREIYAVDIQPEAIAQMCQGIAESMGIGSVLHPVCTDLKELWDGAPLGQLDLVTCNPPYKAYQAGIESQLTAQKIARHEVLCNIYDICRSAKRLLRFGGRLCICNRPERLADCMDAMRQKRHRTKAAAVCGESAGRTAVAVPAGGQKRRQSFSECAASAHCGKRQRCDNTDMTAK